MAPPKLTQKQENFCRSFVEQGNASEAYRRSYNAEKMKTEVIHVKACELLSSGNVSVRVKELQCEAAKRSEITVDDLVSELEEARIMASTAETVQASAMTGATMGKAKLLGFLIDKGEQKVTIDLSSKTDEELKAIIASTK